MKGKRKISLRILRIVMALLAAGMGITLTVCAVQYPKCADVLAAELWVWLLYYGILWGMPLLVVLIVYLVLHRRWKQ